MRTTVKAFRKIIIFITGITVVIIGVVLLVLPGPGLLVMIAGLLILSLEFEWAKKYRDKARAKLRKITDDAKQRQKKFLADDVDRPGDHKSKRKNGN